MLEENGNLLFIPPHEDYHYCVEEDNFDNNELEMEVREERMESRGLDGGVEHDVQRV